MEADAVFCRLTPDEIGASIRAASRRVIYCSAGLTQGVAAALVEAAKRLTAQNVRVVLDVRPATARLGYGQFEAVTLLSENGIEVRQEIGLRVGILVVDDAGFAFFMPPHLVEDVAEVGAMPNGLKLQSGQIDAVVKAVVGSPQEAPETPSAAPEIGGQVVAQTHVEAVGKDLAINPPVKFDLARKVNVFNAYIEFVELKLTGLHVGRHTVKLPNDLLLAIRDADTQRRLSASFKLVDDESKVAAEADKVGKSVANLRNKYLRSLGEPYGSIILRSKRQAFLVELGIIAKQIELFRKTIRERIEKEIAKSIKRLEDGLLPALKRNPPEDLLAQISGKPTADQLRQYLVARLQEQFPSPDAIIGEMKLEHLFKGVTHEVLVQASFQEKVRKAYPYKNFDQPFEQFSAALSEKQGSLPL